jgi:hypothetical protein
MSIAGYLVSKTTPPQVPETGAEHYRDVEDYDPVLQSHCRLSGTNEPTKSEPENEP